MILCWRLLNVRLQVQATTYDSIRDIGLIWFTRLYDVPYSPISARSTKFNLTIASNLCISQCAIVARGTKGWLWKLYGICQALASQFYRLEYQQTDPPQCDANHHAYLNHSVVRWRQFTFWLNNEQGNAKNKSHEYFHRAHDIQTMISRLEKG